MNPPCPLKHVGTEDILISIRDGGLEGRVNSWCGEVVEETALLEFIFFG